jgi:glycolate oxidase
MFYPPDPGSFEICTIGGNLATNAGGMRCVKYGVTRDSALGLEVVLADGTVLHTGSGARKDVAGYDLTSLFIGSEGTLGVITSATLRIRPRPPRDPVTFVASFPTLAAIGHAVDAIAASGVVPSMLELIDQATVNAIEDYRRMDLDRGAAGLLIGQADGAAADDEVRRMTRCCEEAGADLVVQATTAEELAEMLAAVQEVSAGSGIPIATVAHAGDGNLHPVLMLPDLSAETVARAMAAGERLCDHARLLGGTVTGEHGVGVLKQAWLRQQLGPASLAVHQAIKTALDPAGILNPGRAF